MSYIGNEPTIGQWRKLTDISGSFNGVTTSFTTSVPPGTSDYYVTAATANQLIISLGGVIQEPGVDYTVSTNTITFTTAPTSGLSFFGILCGDALNIGTPSDGTVTASKLTNNLAIDLTSGSAATPSLTFDANTGFYSPGEDQVAISTGGTGRLVVDSSGRVGIGTTSPQRPLDVRTSNTTVRTTCASTDYTAFETAVDSGAGARLGSYIGSTSFVGSTTNHPFVFEVNGTEAARFDTSKRLLVGTSSSSDNVRLVVQGRTTTDTTGQGVVHVQRGSSGPGNIGAGSGLGDIHFADSNGYIGASISGQADGTWGAGGSDYPGRLVFSTTADGASSPTERLRIDRDGNLISPQTYASTTSNAANVNIQPDGRLYRSTSSIKYKTDVETLENQYADALLGCRPVWYRSTCASDNPNFGWWGFIAEEVAAIDPRLVHWKTVEITYDDKGSAVETPCDPEPEGVAYDRFVPHLLNLIKRQGEAIAELRAEVAALKTS